MSNSHIDNLVNAVVNKISAVVNNHNSSSNAHSSLLSDYLQTTDVKDNLTSTDTNKPLSANQGKELKALIDNKEDKSNKISDIYHFTNALNEYPNVGAVQDYVSGELNNFVINNDLGLGTVAFSNDYADLNNLPQLGGLAYENDVSNYVGAVALSNDYDDLDNKPTASDITISIDLDNIGTGANSSQEAVNQDIDDCIGSLWNAMPTPTTVNNLDSGFTTSTMQTTNVLTPAGSNNLMQYHFNQSVNEDIGDLWNAIPNVSGKEDKSNKVTSLSSSSDDTQYPSAKLVYNQLSEKATKTELNKKLDADSRIVTTFSPQDYQYIMSNGSWSNKYQISLNANGQLALDLGDMLTSQDDYVEFIVKTGANSVSFGILYGNTNEPITSFPSNSTRRIKVIVGNSLEYTISDESNNILNQFSVPYPVITFSSSSATTLNFGEKQWYHYVPFIDRVYPIGSIYMSVNSVNPSLFIGGEWEQIQDRFLLASGSTYGAGATGGSADAIVVSHSHEPSNTDYKFLGATTNIAINGTKRVFPSSSGGSYHFVYAEDATGGINEYATTNSVGSSGTGKNMPPYLAVYMWKRTA